MTLDLTGIPVEDRFPGWPMVAGAADDDLGDGGGGDGGEGGGGGGGGSDDGDGDDEIDVDQIVKEIDEEAINDLDNHDDDDDEDADGADGKHARRRAADDPIEKYVERNHGGSKEAFLASLDKNDKETRRLSDELAVLRAKLDEKPETTRDVEAEFKAVRDADPDVIGYTGEMAGLKAEWDQVGARQLEISTAARRLEGEIVAGEAELPHLDDQKEWTKQYTTVQKKRHELLQLSAEFQNNEIRQRGIKAEHRTASRELARSEKEIRGRILQEAREAEAENENAEETVKIFSKAFDALIRQFPIDPEKQKSKLTFVRQSIKSQLASHLEALGPSGRALGPGDIYDSVGKLLNAYAEAHDMKPRSAGSPKPRARVPIRGSRQVVLPGRRPDSGRTPRDNGSSNRQGRGAPRDLDAVLSDPDAVRRRAAAIADRLGKAGGSGL